MGILRNVIRPLVPAGIRRHVRERRRAVAVDRAMRAIIAQPGHALTTGSPLLTSLVDAWRNESWSALPEFLSASIQYALQTDGPILECGSGLTTLVLSVVAQNRGIDLWTLEHSAKWGKRVRARLDALRLPTSGLHIAPLRAYNGFDWYDPPRERMPDTFSLVICDGPPHDTPGGRYGLLPVMKDRLAPHAVILLDDAARSEEQNVATRWQEEFSVTGSIAGTDKPYMILTMP